MARKVVIRQTINKDAKCQLADFAKRSGMARVQLSSRLVEWFANQPEMIQGVILSDYPKEMMHRVADAIVSHLRDGKR